ncbi:ABC transporter permease [Bradyrhizobium diazoefficiens]|uniref:ABC transporter permease n=1 Tax=Bradyrhizobium diazoefficiens TaxID=1355477 RepID=UPI00190CBB7B|nr:ABC transporter permease [Bradyrhizobium diazoefficiens]QQO13886.1 ABC transporter permease [Bradyrhizobium diazoefficiens]
MSSYVARRLYAIVALAIGISFLVFLILRLIPGDPVIAMLGMNAGDQALVDRLRHQLGLDRPLYVQYLTWVWDVLRGDFGYSFGEDRPVTSLLAANFPATIQLTLLSLALSLFFGFMLGIIAAVKRNQALDTATMAFALAFMSIPSFWLGLLLILLFAVTLPWFDVVGGTSLGGAFLPALTLALGSIGFKARFVRSTVIAAMAQQHVITARAKGLSRARVFVRHVLRNALLPILTIVGMQIGQLLAGTVIVETVFSRPGIGRLMVQSILAKDYPTVQAVILIMAMVYATTNFIVDMLYPVLDPRIGQR